VVKRSSRGQPWEAETREDKSWLRADREEGAVTEVSMRIT
jgi:hypothetical protein